jgi:hypothetical protein
MDICVYLALVHELYIKSSRHSKNRHYSLDTDNNPSVNSWLSCYSRPDSMQKYKKSRTSNLCLLFGYLNDNLFCRHALFQQVDAMLNLFQSTLNNHGVRLGL